MLNTKRLSLCHTSNEQLYATTTNWLIFLSNWILRRVPRGQERGSNHLATGSFDLQSKESRHCTDRCERKPRRKDPDELKKINSRSNKDTRINWKWINTASCYGRFNRVMFNSNETKAVSETPRFCLHDTEHRLRAIRNLRLNLMGTQFLKIKSHANMA